MTTDRLKEDKAAQEDKGQEVELAKETLEDLDAPATDTDAVKGGQPSRNPYYCY